MDVWCEPWRACRDFCPSLILFVPRLVLRLRERDLCEWTWSGAGIGTLVALEGSDCENPEGTPEGMPSVAGVGRDAGESWLKADLLDLVLSGDAEDTVEDDGIFKVGLVGLE